MKTILLIEDNPDIRENMGEILELANYKVLLAPDGKQGVSMALTQKPDIIVCDIMMPELDGYGVIHLLQKHEDMKRVPFIFITAKTERAEIRKGMELGADDYITKPFSGTELLNAIEGRLKKAAVEKAGQHAEPRDTEKEQDILAVFREKQDVSNYRKKQLIYSEGQHAFRLFYVEQGKVKIFKTNDDGKDLITRVCQEGEFFGYTALLEGGVYKESAEALEAVTIASIPREAFEQLINNSKEAMKQFIRLLAGSVREKEDQLLGLAYNSLRKKVAEALVMLENKYRTDVSTATVISISRENLASVAGTAKESLIRTLSDFREEGLIEIKGSDIIILSTAKLVSLFN
jgi:CRP/FNR family cyclic AMP-dependent transcriptional regulator